MTRSRAVSKCSYYRRRRQIGTDPTWRPRSSSQQSTCTGYEWQKERCRLATRTESWNAATTPSTTYHEGQVCIPPYDTGIPQDTQIVICNTTRHLANTACQYTYLWHCTDTLSSSARIRKTRISDARFPVRPLFTTKFLHTLTVASSNMPWSTLHHTHRDIYRDSQRHTDTQSFYCQHSSSLQSIHCCDSYGWPIRSDVLRRFNVSVPKQVRMPATTNRLHDHRYRQLQE